MYILGYNKYLYNDNLVTRGKNGNFIYTEKEYEGYVVYLKENENYYSINLFMTYGVCSSGYTTATWGHMEIKKIIESDLPKIEHVPKTELYLYSDLDLFFFMKEKNEEDEEDYDNKYSLFKSNVFEYYKYGSGEESSDSWYPAGYVVLNIELFD